jgi:Holliday junction resolvase RusA-like endonuclease
MNVTEEQLRELERNIRNGAIAQCEVIENAPKMTWVGPRPPAGGSRKPKVATFDGPLDVTLKLYGHCPSKKNEWQRGKAGKMFLPAEVTEQINTLTTQAMFHWGSRLPVEHPDVTIRFFVCARRQDEDGMWTAVLDCLQRAGVIVNDNVAHFNGRKVHEPCEFVSESEERVEIRLVKN